MLKDKNIFLRSRACSYSTENYCSGTRLDESSLPETSSFCVASTKRCLTKRAVFSRSQLVQGRFHTLYILYR